MNQQAPSLAELAGYFGIATEYQDWSGRRIEVPQSTLVAVLAAFGVAAATESERGAAQTAHDRRYWSRALPPTILGRPGAPTTFWVHVTHGQPADVWLRLEDGTIRDGIRQVDNFTAPFDLDGRSIGEASFVLPDDLPLGYHRVHVRSGDHEASAALIVTPGWLGLPERLGARRAWGLAAQLYSVPVPTVLGDRRPHRSRRPRSLVGVGTRRRLCPGQSAARVRTDRTDGTVAVSADVTPVRQPAVSAGRGRPEFAQLRKRGRVRRLRDGVQKHAATLDAIDRDSAWAAKRAALELVFSVPRTAGRRTGVCGLSRPRGCRAG